MLLETVLLIGMFHHKKPATPIPAPQMSLQILKSKALVELFETKIPEWYKDEAYARFEMEELATVQADIANCHAAKEDKGFYEAFDKLVDDWAKLSLLDERLHIEVYT